MIEWGIWCLGVDEVSGGFEELYQFTHAPDSWISGLEDSDGWSDAFSSGFAERMSDMLSFGWEEAW